MSAPSGDSRMKRFVNTIRPGVGSLGAGMWAPVPQASTDRQDTEIEREVEQIADAVAEAGVVTRRRLAELVGARFWGPGRFRRALRMARATGRIRQVRRGMYGDPSSFTSGAPTA